MNAIQDHGEGGEATDGTDRHRDELRNEATSQEREKGGRGEREKFTKRSQQEAKGTKRPRVIESDRIRPLIFSRKLMSDSLHRGLKPKWGPPGSHRWHRFHRREICETKPCTRRAVPGSRFKCSTSEKITKRTQLPREERKGAAEKERDLRNEPLFPGSQISGAHLRWTRARRSQTAATAKRSQP